MRLVSFFAVVLLVVVVHGTHLRSAVVAWQRSSTSAYTATFTVQYGIRLTYTWPNPAGSGVTAANAIGRTVGAPSSFYFGDGNSVSPPYTIVAAAYGGGEDYYIAQATFSHTYPTPLSSGAPWKAYLSTGDRLSTLLNNRDRSMVNYVDLDLTLPNAASPIVSGFARYTVVKPGVITIPISVTDIYDRPTSFRLSTGTEMVGSSVGIQPAGLSIDANTGVMTWDVTSVQAGLWCTQIMISNSVGQVPFDFLIQVMEPIAGNTVPAFVSPTPAPGSFICTSSGTPVTFTLQATDAQSPTQTLLIFNGALPIGATLSTQTGTTSPVSAVFNWTPSASQTGKYGVCFAVSDSIGYMSAQTCVFITVNTAVSVPVVTGIVPSASNLLGGAPVTVRGSGFVNSGDILCRIVGETTTSPGTFLTATSVVCGAPPAVAVGSTNIEVSLACDVYSNSATFTYYETPVLASKIHVIPYMDNVAASITVVGSGFYNNVPTCKLGSTVMPAVFVNTQTAVCQVPAMPQGDYLLSFSNEGTYFTNTLSMSINNLVACCPVLTIANDCTHSVTYTDTCSSLPAASVTAVTMNIVGNQRVYTASAQPNVGCLDTTTVSTTLYGPKFTIPSTPLSRECDRSAHVLADVTTPVITGGIGAAVLPFADQVHYDCGGAGTVIRTWTASDCDGVFTALQTINIVDTQPPSFVSFPVDVELECGESSNTMNPELTGRPVAVDSCGPTAYDYDDLPFQLGFEGQCGQTYRTLRKWIFRDVCGNKIEQVQTITLVDTTKPTWTSFPADYTGECGTVPATCESGHPVAADSCGNVVYTHSDETLANGNIVRTFTATDNCGNFITRDQNIILQDTIAPVITSRPASYALECGSQDPLTAIQATDSCSSVSISHSDVFTAACGATGVVHRTWTATDVAGHVSTHVNTITIKDTVHPSISTPASQLTLSCSDPSVFDTSSAGSATATDACDPTVTITHSDVVVAGCGTTQTVARTWTATDDCGQTSTGRQTLTSVDIVGPTITLPADVSVPCTSSTSPSVTGSATASDECGSASTPTYSDVVVRGNCDTRYTIKRTWKSVDECRNTATAVQTITVTDDAAPTVPSTPRCIYPPNKKWVCFDKASTSANFVAPSDTCSSSSALTITLTGCSISENNVPANTAFKTDCKLTSNDRMCFLAQRLSDNTPRVYTVDYRVADTCGNAVTGTQTVTVPVSGDAQCIAPTTVAVRSLLGDYDEELAA